MDSPVTRLFIMRPPATFSPPTTVRHALPWVSLVSAMFLLTYLDRAMFGPMLPALEKEFAIDHSQSTGFLFFISVGYAASTLFSAYTCSRFLPRTLVALALMTCGLVLLIMGQTTSLPLLYCLFAALGFSAGHYFNGGMSTMRSLVRPEHWSRAIAIHELGPNISFVLGPMLAGLGAAYFGWRAIVSCMGVVTFAGGLLFWRIAKGGTVAPPPVSLRGIGSVLKEPKFWLFTWLVALGIAGEFAPYSVLSLYLTNELGYSQDLAALLLTLSRILPPCGVVYGGWITSRYGSIPVLFSCLIGFSAGMFLMALPWFFPMLIGMFLQPLATSLAFPAIFTFLADFFHEHDQPVLLALSIPLASILGSGLIPSMLGFFGDYSSFTHGFIILGLFVLGTIVWVQPGRYRKKEIS